MKDLSEGEERNRVDNLADCLYSTDFLLKFTDKVFKQDSKEKTISQFYSDWSKINKREGFMPFSKGNILGTTYVCLLYAKENWFDLIPETQLREINEHWGLKGVEIINPMKEPNLKLIIRKIRNALGHGNVSVKTTTGMTRDSLFDEVSYNFSDRNKDNPEDIFSITLTLGQLINLLKSFQSLIHSYVRKKYDITPEKLEQEKENYKEGIGLF